MTTQQQYEILRKELNEQQWRLFLGTEALKIGYGGISLVAALSGSDELGQMDDAFASTSGQGTVAAGTSHQEVGPGRVAARAGLFAQSQQENDGGEGSS